MANSRSYVASLPGGTATTTVQAQQNGNLKMICLSMVSAAAGSVEVSLNPTSQIATAQPNDVLARARINGAAGWMYAQFPVNVALKPFQNVYVHQTGAANVGEATLITA